MIETFDELVLAFGGVATMASRLGVVRTAIHNWEARREIPPRQRDRILDLACALGIEGVSYEALRGLAFDEPGPVARADCVPASRADCTSAHHLSAGGGHG